MGNLRGWIVLAAAIVLGLGAAKGASVWVNARVASEVSSRAGDTRPQKDVLIATRDLAISSRLGADDIQLVKMPVEVAPATSIDDAQLVVGRITRTKIFAGEALLEPKLAPKGARGGLQAVIPEGMRAMTVKVNDVIGVAGFVLPGARVDIVAVIKQQSASQPPWSKVVLQNIEVLAVDQLVESENEKPKPSSAITLLVTPSDSERLALAVNQGEIQFVMRSFADDRLVVTPGTDASSMASRPIAGTSAPAVSNSVEVIENNQRSKTSVQTQKGGTAAVEQLQNVKVR